MRPDTRDTSRTIQERIAATHVRELEVNLEAMAAISNLFRITNLFRGVAEKRFLDRHQLSFSGFTAMWVLWVFGEMETHRLANECGIAKGTLTGIVTTLEKRDFAERRPHATDGRRRLVRLTQRGASLMKKLFLQINRLECEFVAELKPDEVQQMNRLSRIILHTPEHQG